MGLILCKTRSIHDYDKANDKYYGRRPERNTIESRFSFAHWKVCNDYMKCNILPWKKILSLDEPIGLEPLPTEFLDRKKCRRQYFVIEGEKYERVVGFREIFMKREFAEYLRDVQGGEDKCGYPSPPASFPEFEVVNEVPQWKLARGGGPKRGGGNSGKAGRGGKAGVGGRSSVANKDKGGKKKSGALNVKGGSGGSKKKGGKSGRGGQGCLAGLFSGGGGGGALKKKSKLKKGQGKSEGDTPKDPATVLREQKAKRWKWPNQRKRYPKPTNPKFIVLLNRLYRYPKENQERDNEWLYLSDTDPDEDVVKSFDKPFHSWMVEGISFESQKLLRQIRVFLACLTFTGRSFLHIRNNYARGHVEYSAHKKNMLPFAMTSIILWTILGLFLYSFLDIVGTDFSNPNPFLKLEKIELLKYWIPFSVIVGNLVLVAFWSLVVLIEDSPLIAHYLNCWCAALHEMETSGALDIRKMTFRNIILFFIFAGVYATMFTFNWPKLVRGSCGLTAMLMLRSAVPFLRVSQPGMLLFYQWIGLGVQLYILWCARFVMTLLQIFALMVKNVCEMWNFKFALTFKLLAVQNRGQLYHLKLNHSLGKLWSHHKIITALQQQYGFVFGTAILCYMIPQIFIFAVVLSKIMIYDADPRKKFYGRSPNILIYSDAEPTIKIPYYHPVHEEVIMAVLVLIHTAIDFIFTSETLASASDAYMTGADFVRRAGIMSSSKSHERKLLFSLRWSFSPTQRHAMTANNFFDLSRHTLYKAFGFIFVIVSILLRIENPDNPFKVTFPKRGSCNMELGQTLVRGICTITGNPIYPPPPGTHAPEYYFFMNDCVEIEKSFKNLVKSFDYYTDISRNGVKRKADLPPFQICKITLANGTELPQQLSNFGRYIVDRGSPKIKETLDIYMDRTYDPSTINYQIFKIATSHSHPLTTGGHYCGPDVAGQPNKKCEWVEYYRDCVTVCYSNELKKRILIPLLFKKDPNPRTMTSFIDYQAEDCGLNPFATIGTSPTYDCFGNVLNIPEFDDCGNLPYGYPIATFTPAQGDPLALYQGYHNAWFSALKSFNMIPIPGKPTCPDPNIPKKCYNTESGIARCSNLTMVKDFCPLAQYSGKAAKGYFHVDKCFELDIADHILPNGFCPFNVMQGAIDSGHAVSEADYAVAETKFWNINKSFKLRKDKVPCHNYEKLPNPVLQKLYFQHLCVTPKPVTSTNPCDKPSYFPAYRPYKYDDCKEELTLIDFDYKIDDGNKEICDKRRQLMKTPGGNVTNFVVKGSSVGFANFYGCHGKPLMPVSSNYTCIGPELAGVCEMDVGEYYLLYKDCFDPSVNDTKYIVGYEYENRARQSGKLLACRGFIDKSHPAFKGKKLIPPKLWDQMKGNHFTTRANKSKLTVAGTPSCNAEYSGRFCGRNNVALHYPFDPWHTNLAADQWKCNWEVYIRDCLEADITSKFGKEVETVYLPKQYEKNTNTNRNRNRAYNLRSRDPLLAVFNYFHDSTLYEFCDERQMPIDTSQKITVRNGGKDKMGTADLFWMDDCGWPLTDPQWVDDDSQGLAIMAPIVPIVLTRLDANGTPYEQVRYCSKSELGLYRCQHPEMNSYLCQSISRYGSASTGFISPCFRYNEQCYTYFSRKPISTWERKVPQLVTAAAPKGSLVPPGFCHGFCAYKDLHFANEDMEGGITKPAFYTSWLNLEKNAYKKPPCNASNEFNGAIERINYMNLSSPRDVEKFFLFRYHCFDSRQNALIDSSTTKLFHFPFVKDRFTNDLVMVPREDVIKHWEENLGPNCEYTDPDEIYMKKYPNFYSKIGSLSINTFRNHSIDYAVRRKLYGCHGLPLINLDYEIKNSSSTYHAKIIGKGATNASAHYDKVCFGPSTGPNAYYYYSGWCECRVC